MQCAIVAITALLPCCCIPAAGEAWARFPHELCTPTRRRLALPCPRMQVAVRELESTCLLHFTQMKVGSDQRCAWGGWTAHGPWLAWQ